MDNQPFTNEAGLLACLIHKRELHAQLPLSLNHDKFHDPRLAKAFEIYQRILQETQSPPDAISWERELDAVGVNSATDKLIAAIYNSVPIDYAIPENIRMYADGILREWTRQEYIHLGSEIQTKMSDVKVDVIEGGKKIYKRFTDINQQSSSMPPVSHISESVKRNEAYKRELRDGSIKRILLGFTDLDKKLRGLRTGRTVVVAAATGMGKSSFAMGGALNIAKSGHGTAIFSLEMSESELVDKLISLESGLELECVQEGLYEDNPKQFEVYKKAAQVVSSLPIYIEDKSGVTVSDIESRIQQLKIEKGISVVVIDHCGLLAPQRPSAGFYENATENYIALKRMAKDLDVLMIELVQLNRAPTTRKDKQPQLSDTSQTSETVNSADLVLFIYRDDYYFPDEPKNPNVAEISIGKNRHGATGKVDMFWDAKRTAFKDLASRELHL